VNLIRPLERADLPEVTALYELVARSGRSTPPPGLAPFFERVLLDQPWADPEIPSLVHLDDTGAIVAFQGSSVRRARFDGRPIKIACAGQFVAHPAARRRAVGALLLRTYLGGAQALTITDTAGSARMREIWRLCGGEMLPAACIDWFRFLRPLASAEWYLRARRNAWRQRRGGRLLEVLDAAATRTIGFMSPPPAPDSTAQPLTAAGLVEHLPVVCGRVRLHLDYDERFVAWLLKELAEVSGLGTPVAHLVREQGGRVLGWYVYYSPPNGVCQVLQVAAAGQDVGRVLDHLLHDAWTRGAIAISGRIEPQLMEPLAQRRFVMRWAGGAALVHSRDAQILYAITSGRSLLTRLDGEWWIQDNEVDLGAPA
jgi:hypothetical protein